MSPTTPPVLVLGASGNLGAATAEALRRRGAPVRVTSATPEGLRRLAGRFPGAQTRLLDLMRPETFAAAVEDVDRVFLMRPPAIARVGPTVNALVDAAVEAGAEHVVFASVAGAERNRAIPHHRIEAHLRRSGVGWTFLRPGFFAQNLATSYGSDIREDDRIVVPAGRGRVAFVDTRDFGHAAAAVLYDPGSHAGKAYHLTGSEALDFDEVAAILTRVLRRPVAYLPTSAAGYARHLRRQGLPAAQILVQTVLHVGLRRGDAEAVTPDLGRLSGRAPTTLEQYVVEHRSSWLPDSPA